MNTFLACVSHVLPSFFCLLFLSYFFAAKSQPELREYRQWIAHKWTREREKRCQCQSELCAFLFHFLHLVHFFPYSSSSADSCVFPLLCLGQIQLVVSRCFHYDSLLRLQRNDDVWLSTVEISQRPNDWLPFRLQSNLFLTIFFSDCRSTRSLLPTHYVNELFMYLINWVHRRRLWKIKSAACDRIPSSAPL